ncbi:C4-dicarboxylate ABC transporter, partial [Campylobacter helveticus]
KRTAPLLLIAMLVNISVSFYLAKANPPQNEAKIEKRI